MARAITDSEEDTPASTSGAATPSTAATSLAGKGKGRAKAESDSEEEVEVEEMKVQVKPARFVPRRKASTVVAKKSAPVIDLSMDTSSDDDLVSAPTLSRQLSSASSSRIKSSVAKGKGKAASYNHPDDSLEYTDGDKGEEEDELDSDDASAVKGLARALASHSNVETAASRAKGKAVASKVTKRMLKGKGKSVEKAQTKGKRMKVENSEDEVSDVEMALFIAPDGSEKESSGSEDEEEEEVDVKSGKLPTRKGAVLSSAVKSSMKKMSLAEKNDILLKANHPELVDCWDDLAAMPIITPAAAEQPDGLTQKLLPFQLEGLNWMMKQEAGPWAGGILADEMGMGKTIQTIGLILSDHKKDSIRPTLVLAPTVAIMQWKNEIHKFTEGFKVLVFHGANRIDNVKDLQKYDVVLTSYAVMESGFRRENKGFMKKGTLMKEDSIMHKIKWHRVILDEAHNIKDRQSNTAKAAFALKAKYRWCLSGTPLQNRVGELYSLIRFIGADPFAHFYCKRCDCKSLHWLSVKGPCSECRHSGMQHVCYWNNEILKPIQYGGAASGEGGKAFKKLTTLLERLMLRRTKVERADDMGLPPRVVNVRRDFFTEEEEEIYQSLFKDVKRKFNTYANEGTVLNNYSNIFTLITRMRQMADHPDLVTKSRTAAPVDHAPGDAPQEILTCRICLDEAEDAVATASCRHVFCRACIVQYLDSSFEDAPECPVCRLQISIDLEQEAMQQDTTGRQGFLSRIDPSKMKTSTKIEALVEELSKLRTEDCTLKSLVFSQFTTMLDLVSRRLQLGGFNVVRLQGTMTPAARDNTVKLFMNNPEVTVFLISLKAGGVALNLTEASRVFILDPWWNPAVEMQAIDRIHRIGQNRPVIATRLIIENSIESRIVELQRKKENLAASALGDDDKAMGRLTPEDLQFLFQL